MNKKVLFTALFFGLLAISCKTDVSVTVPLDQQEVVVNSAGSSVDFWIEMCVESSSGLTGDFTLAGLSMNFNISNLTSQDVFMDLFVCSEGEATNNEHKIYITEQSRWTNQSKTDRIFDNVMLPKNDEFLTNIVRTSADKLIEIMQQDKFWVVVRCSATNFGAFFPGWGSSDKITVSGQITADIQKEVGEWMGLIGLF